MTQYTCIRIQKMLILYVACSIASWHGVAASFAAFDLYKTNTTSYGIPDNTTKTRSRHDCIWKCSGDGVCQSITFDGEHRCTTNRLTANSSVICGGTLGQCDGQAALMYAQKRMKTTMRLDCLGHSDCVDPRSICVLNKCQCEPGYHYDGTHYACVTSCTNYGTTFQSDYGKTIDGNNKKIIMNVTLDTCFALCIEQTGFICRSLEYNGNTLGCRLAIVTALDVPDNYRNSKQNTLYTSRWWATK